MLSNRVRVALADSVPMEEVEGTLQLSMMAVESLFGAGRVALEVEHHVDRAKRVITIDTSTDVGRALAIIFDGYVQREFGDRAAHLERAEPPGKGNVAGAVA